MRYLYLMVRRLVLDIFTLSMQDLGHRHRDARPICADQVSSHHVRRPEEVQVFLLVCLPGLCLKACMGDIRSRLDQR